MKSIISNEKGINSIWVIDPNNPNVISQGKIVITNDAILEELIKELRDIRTYICTHTVKSIYPKEQLLFTLDGAEIYEKKLCENGFGGTRNEYGYTISYYSNPRSPVYRLITGNLDSDASNLLDLFKTSELNGYKTEQCFKEFMTAIQLLQALETNALDSDMLKKILKRTWPNFGYYATEGLKCTDIEMLQEYDVSELIASASCSRAGEEILAKRAIAESNGKVLRLARKAHNLTYPNK